MGVREVLPAFVLQVADVVLDDLDNQVWRVDAWMRLIELGPPHLELLVNLLVLLLVFGDHFHYIDEENLLGEAEVQENQLVLEHVRHIAGHLVVHDEDALEEYIVDRLLCGVK